MSAHFHHTTYRYEYLNENYELLRTESGYIALNKTDNWLEFAVLEHSYIDSTGVFLSCFWHGSGPHDTLRECRHSYFGTPPNPHNGEEGIDGYVFYINGKLITEAFEVLSEYFDNMR